MNIFKTTGIILKKINKNKDLIYIIFTKEYGKITLFSKNSNKEKKLDLGYIISFEIKTNKNNLYLQNIKIINEFNYLNFSFEIINLYQILITLIYKLAPEKKQIFNILEIVEKINDLTKNEEISEEKLEEKIIFACLKILNILGFLNIENKNIEIKKILNFINKNNFLTIIKLTGLKQNTKSSLKKIIEKYIKN